MPFINRVLESSKSAIYCRWFFKKKANTLYLSGKRKLDSMFEGFIGRSIRSDIGITTIKTTVIDTPIRLIGLLSNFNELPWDSPQWFGHVIKINAYRDNLDPNQEASIIKFNVKEAINNKAPYFTSLDINDAKIIKNPFLNYYYPCYETEVLSFAYNIVNSQKYKTALTTDKDDVALRAGAFVFLDLAIIKKEDGNQGFSDNLMVMIRENTGFMEKYTFSTKFDKDAVSPRELCPLFSAAKSNLKLFGGAVFYDAPIPKKGEYLDGWGEAKIMLCLFIHKKFSYSFNSIELDGVDKNYFKLDKWDKYDWNDSASGVLGQIPDNKKLQGYMPNKIDNLIPVLYSENINGEEQNRFKLFFSGVRCIGTKQDGKQVIQAQTALVSLAFEINDKARLVEQKIIAHDLSGYAQDANFKENGATDSKKWSIYNLFWGGRIGTNEVLLVHVTKHKRFKNSITNYVGSSTEDRHQIGTSNVELFLHVYINGKLHEFEYQNLGFQPMLYNDYAIIRENLYNRNYAECNTPILNKKYGSIVSEDAALFCFIGYLEPKKNVREVRNEDVKETCLVKMTLENEKPVFNIIRKDSSTKGCNNVVTCYQQEIKKQGKIITPFAAFYRIGDEGVKGETYLTRNSGKTWDLVNNDKYNYGGGLYFIGNQFYKKTHGKAFKY